MSVIVNTVSEVLVGVQGTVVQNQPPHQEAAHRLGVVPSVVNTCQFVQIGSLVNNHQEFL